MCVSAISDFKKTDPFLNLRDGQAIASGNLLLLQGGKTVKILKLAACSNSPRQKRDRKSGT